MEVLAWVAVLVAAVLATVHLFEQAPTVLGWLARHRMHRWLGGFALAVLGLVFALAFYVSRQGLGTQAPSGDFFITLWGMPNGLGALLGALLGFLAAIGVAYYTTEKARQREEDKLADDRRALAASLLGEVGAIHAVIIGREEYTRTPSKRACPSLPRDTAYKVSQAKIGILGSACEEVARLYFRIDEINSAFSWYDPSVYKSDENINKALKECLQRIEQLAPKLAEIAGLPIPEFQGLKGEAKEPNSANTPEVAEA